MDPYRRNSFFNVPTVVGLVGLALAFIAILLMEQISEVNMRHFESGTPMVQQSIVNKAVATPTWDPYKGLPPFVTPEPGEL